MLQTMTKHINVEYVDQPWHACHALLWQKAGHTDNIEHDYNYYSYHYHAILQAILLLQNFIT